MQKSSLLEGCGLGYWGWAEKGAPELRMQARVLGARVNIPQ